MDQQQWRQQQEPQYPEAPVLGPNVDPTSTCPDSTQDSPGDGGSKPSLNRNDIVKALEVVERDSVAIAESFSSLFASLRLALSEITDTSVNHMQCFSDAAGRLQESVLDAATKGNRYINSCLRKEKLLTIDIQMKTGMLCRLNEEMKGVDSLAAQLYPS
ncbi:hypothetical protein Pint_15158 [Pistacia integerrima]|uniref:Uncharacterized protein n=1 Tax=Pistacia integerrima TaxID=434235 RepID=A0ACC0ZCE6_9ROSI|nr:hypothetical protein Pint_15158 [Pistacia integerrima]